MGSKARLIALGLAGAIALTPVFEGLRLLPYTDPVGIWTDCYGHTGSVQPGVRNTQAQCDEKLHKDLLEAHRVVRTCTKVPLNPNELSALTDFAFNVGPGKKGVKDGYCTLKSGRTPTFLQHLNSGRYPEGCRALSAWTKAGGRELPGLVKRRAANVALCLKESDVPRTY